MLAVKAIHLFGAAVFFVSLIALCVGSEGVKNTVCGLIAIWLIAGIGGIYVKFTAETEQPFALPPQEQYKKVSPTFRVKEVSYSEPRVPQWKVTRCYTTKTQQVVCVDN
jgi:hypothetical protein